tara:strand:- start:809 stop:2602 length:1794 start_codon:yes stop_codon:yes gene_type:complete
MKTQPAILVTTAIDFNFKKSKKNIILLGEWCKINKKYLEKDLTHKVQKCHWTDFNKLKKDSKYIENQYERILSILYKDLNKLNKKKNNKRYWRIIVGPWLTFYIATMFDRWETIRIFFKKNKNLKTSYLKNINKNILTSKNTLSFLYNAQNNDIWNHENFLRIINFNYKENINHQAATINVLKKNKIKVIKNNFKTIIRYFVTLIDTGISFFALKYNRVILDSFQFSKLDLIKLHLKSKMIPAFYINTFKDLELNSNRILEYNKRKLLLKDLDFSNKSFLHFLVTSLRDDLPICFLEEFNKINSSVAYLSSQRKKTIITMTSHFFNERFKIWLAEMTSKGSKLQIAHHGGSLPPKLSLFIDHNDKISDKILSWFKFNKKIFKQMSPVQLLRFKKIHNKSKNTCLILACETNRYPVRCQSWPYVEQYKLWLNDINIIVENLQPIIQKKVIYRCSSDQMGFGTINRFKQKFKKLKSTDIHQSNLTKELSKAKLTICTYPDTTIADSIMSDTPTIIVFSTKLYRLSKQSNKIIKYLKKNNIFFDDMKKASKHVNNIWRDPNIWWKSSKVQVALARFKKDAFNVKENWIEEWSNHINIQSH